MNPIISRNFCLVIHSRLTFSLKLWKYRDKHCVWYYVLIIRESTEILADQNDTYFQNVLEKDYGTHWVHRFRVKETRLLDHWFKLYTIYESPSRYFGWMDYLIFALTLVISIFIGIDHLDHVQLYRTDYPRWEGNRYGNLLNC